MPEAATIIQDAPKRFDAFNPSWLDDYGLDPYEFRVYMRVRRREAGLNGRGCDESAASIARACGMSERKVRACLKVLTQAGLIHATERSGQTSVYRSQPVSDWVDRAQLEGVRREVTPSTSCRGEGSAPGATPAPPASPPGTACRGTPAPGAGKEYPSKSIPKGKPPYTPRQSSADPRASPRPPTTPSRKRDDARRVIRGFYRLWNSCKPDTSAALISNREVDRKVKMHLKQLGRAEFFARCRAALAFVRASEFHTRTRPCPAMTLLRHLDSYAEQGASTPPHTLAKQSAETLSTADQRLLRTYAHYSDALGGTP